MPITPETVIKDLENYLDIFQLGLSNDARTVVYNTEMAACRHNNSPTETLYLSEIIKESDDIRKALKNHSCNPDLACYEYRKHFIEYLDDNENYDDVSHLYSNNNNRNLQTQTSVLDNAINICIEDGRNLITTIDLFIGVIKFFNDYNPPYDNGGWKDKSLYVTYNTLSHIIGSYNKNLFIKIDDIIDNLTIVKQIE